MPADGFRKSYNFPQYGVAVNRIGRVVPYRLSWVTDNHSRTRHESQKGSECFCNLTPSAGV